VQKAESLQKTNVEVRTRNKPKLNPLSESVWEGRIIIEKIAGKYDVQYQAENAQSEAARRIVREHIDKLKEELSKRL
jgi:hypothetical protein